MRQRHLRRAAALFVGLAAGLNGTALALAPAASAAGAAVAGAPPVDTSSGAPPQGALVQQQSFSPLVKRVLPAVVNISVTRTGSAEEEMSQEGQLAPFPNFPESPFDEFLRRFFKQQDPDGPHPFFPHTPGPETRRIALGSGFLIDPSGYVVTNNHVIGSAGKVVVVLQTNKKYEAKIVGRDPKTDIALLKIDAGAPLPYVTFGDSSAAQVGDWVMAVGNPFGLGGTVTTGIISARGRDIHSGPFDDFLQIDAPINRGNSGGPTFNLSGQVIGINTAIYSPNGGSVGIGFAIPSNVAKTVVAQLERHGKVTRGWLGVQIQQVTPAIASSLGLPNENGALVALVTPNSPGAKAGLKQGDVILSFDGHTVKQLRDLPRLVAAAAPNSPATLSVWRDGRRLALEATLGEFPNNPQLAAVHETQPEEEAGASASGMHFAMLTERLRRTLRVGKDARGVVVTGVDNGSPADEVGLAEGDVVVTIDQQPVRTPEQAVQKLRQAEKSTKKSALLLLNRHGVTEYVGLPLGGDKEG
ncbi:MAG TPA: DegQ family serine endoprotease [Stellaceae bacterium]|nr:DegQ family serine endoprotease [Stellaceae bacterium]